VVGVSDEGVPKQKWTMSMWFSANLCAYLDMPSFLSQSAICYIAAAKVRYVVRFWPTTTKSCADKSAYAARAWICFDQMPWALVVACHSKVLSELSPQIVSRFVLLG
jgi:hypothetical protein